MSDKDTTILTLAGMLAALNIENDGNKKMLLVSEEVIHDLVEENFEINQLRLSLAAAEDRAKKLLEIVTRVEMVFDVDTSVPSDKLPHIAEGFKSKADAFDKLEPIVEKIRRALEMSDRLEDEEIPVMLFKALREG